jgi:hypothetical protein
MEETVEGALLSELVRMRVLGCHPEPEEDIRYLCRTGGF